MSDQPRSKEFDLLVRTAGSVIDIHSRTEGIGCVGTEFTTSIGIELAVELLRYLVLYEGGPGWECEFKRQVGFVKGKPLWGAVFTHKVEKEEHEDKNDDDKRGRKKKE